jgi:GntR family transcriptional regulator
VLIVVDAHSGVPVYRQIMDQIRFHVASGLLKPGEELPSTRALSAQLAVNPMTISKSYALLEREGLLERRPGLPLVVAAIPARKARSEKQDQLRASLAASAAMARQLGLTQEEALELFGEVLHDHGGPDRGNAEG